MNLRGLEVPQWKYDDLKAAGWPDEQIYLSVLGSDQKGSQYWMNSGYTGPEPDLATKAAFSQATYARDWIGGYAATLEAIGVNLSPAVSAIADYPITQESVDVWKQYPAVGPGAAAAANYGQSLIESAGTAVSKATAPREGPGGGPAAGLAEILQGGLAGAPSWLLPVGLALAAILVLPALTRGRGYG